MIAGQDGDTLVVFSPDDEAKMTFNTGFVVGFSELFVKKAWGDLLSSTEVRVAGVVGLERFEDEPHSFLLLWAEPFDATL